MTLLIERVSSEAAPDSGRLVIRTFGPLAVYVGGKLLPKMRTRKEPWLLALLVLYGVERPVDRDWLAATLWPETIDTGALYNLRRSLGVLREALGPEAARILSPTPRTLHVDMDGADCDILRFDAAIRQSHESTFVEAVELYTGPLLLGCVEDWVFEPRAARMRGVLTALEALAHAAAARGDSTAAAHYLRSILDHDPLRESSLRSLMALLAAQGNHAAAAEQFHQFRKRLRREANAEPDPETVQLNRRILLETRRAADSVVFEMPRARRAAISGDEPAAILSTADRLIGRAESLREVVLLLTSNRLVTLTGPGGIGKTSLALSAMDLVAKDFRDGVRFIDLAPQVEPEQVVTAIADALGVADSPARTPLDALTDYLATRQILVVFDNCEHIIGETSRLAQQLLVACAGLKILATSREPLRVIEQARVAVPVLADADAVTLFELRALQARPSFQLTPPIRTAVTHICRRLDGIPLAIEMAAAWIRAMTAAQISARLDDAFRLLTRPDAGDEELAPRHRTLRATLDWSYSLLTEKEQSLLARLSIFSGGWTLEASEFVCPVDDALPGSEILEVLVALVDRSLVVYAEDVEGNGRYRFLEITRAYAAERLLPIERAALQTNLARYLLNFSETAKRHWQTPKEAMWLQLLDVELPNIRVALSEPLPADVAADRIDLRLPTLLMRFWWRRGHFLEGRRHLLAALRRCSQTDETEQRAAALNASGVLAMYRRDLDAAEDDLSAAVSIRRILGDSRAIATSLCNLAQVQRQHGNVQAARDLLTEAIALHRLLHDDERANKWQGMLDDLNAGVAGATDRTVLLERLESAERLGNRGEESHICQLVALNLLHDGQQDAARVYARRSVLVAVTLGDRIRTAEFLETLAIVLVALGRQDALPRLYAAASRMRETVDCAVLSRNRDAYQANVDRARAHFGDAVFDAEWAAGQAMTLEETVAYAMAL